MKKPKTTHPFGKREGLALEFKEAAHALPKSFFETVCAFLNLDGGLIVLGVADDGTVTGVAPDAVDRLKAEIANLSNNPEKLDPPYLLFPRSEEIGGKQVIKVQVPASSQVHRTGGHVFIRSEEVATTPDSWQDTGIGQSFLDALPLLRQPRANLYALYQGWIDTVLALLAAQVTGTYALAKSPEEAATRQAALVQCAHLETQMADLRAKAAKESQIPRQVDLNLELKRAEAEYSATRAKL